MILIADDDKAIRISLTLLLKRAGYETIEASTAAETIEIVKNHDISLVLLDMNFSRATSGDEGLTLLRQIHIFKPRIPVVLMTAWGNIPLAVEGIKAGAHDFVSKPWDNRKLLDTIATALRLSDNSESSKDAEFDRSPIIGNSSALNSVLDTIRRVAATNAPVLITGENGTGKELIAETLHRNSLRRNAPFVKVNLGGMSRTLFESEMFGHRKGAFTGAITDRKGRFQIADKGTIFLDEIGDLDLNSQVKLLRVLQEHTFEMLGDSQPCKVDIRVICATNADLHKMVADKTFREDLYYRINLITVSLPALRERKEDIPLLARHFAAMISPEVSISDDAMDFLVSLSYPGNIRELKNLVERTILISGHSELTSADFQNATSIQPENLAREIDKGNLEDMERAAVQRALILNPGNHTAAAASLGISRQALYRRMKKYGC